MARPGRAALWGLRIRVATGCAALSICSAIGARVALAGGAHVAGAGASAESDAAPHAVVDQSTFWYEAGRSCSDTARAGVPCAPAGTAARVAAALAAVLRDHPADFPLPPPMDVVVRACSRDDLPGTLRSVTDLFSYGGTEVIDGAAVVEVNLVAFVGETPLNDAELRSFLAHEMVHVYQDAAAGPAARNGPELWRREIEAHEWELLHMEPGVRSWYRAEAIFNLEMYRRILAEE